METNASTLLVKTGKDQSYTIYFEQSFAGLASCLEKDCHISGRKICIVSDSNVFPLYGDDIVKELNGKCVHLTSFIFPAGEKNKTLDIVRDLYEHLILEHFERRDLILALSDALRPYDIDLYLYFTGDGPYKDVECGEKFGFVEPRKHVSIDFCRRWASVLEEYAVRYGDRVRGWWIDGCYDYFGYDEERLSYYHNAVKKGNPNAMTAMNNGVKDDLLKWYSGDEFTCGEYNFFDYIPHSRSINGAQAHILAPLGLSADGSPWGGWNRPGCKCTKAELRAYVNRVHDAGCVVTIDFPIRPDCTLDADQLEVLSGIR